jgi:2-polyprenyl-6-methoxyphenol hydroxylase-like FAD-dependent oxidoreductase
MGQGCNSALEDCVLLARALEGADYDIKAGLAAYDRKRAPQVGGRRGWGVASAATGCSHYA